MKRKKYCTDYRNLLILNDFSKFSLPLGDYLRILTFLPNLKFEKIYFVGDERLNKLINEISYINFIRFKNKRKINSLKKKSFIFDMVNLGKNSQRVFYLRSIIKKKNKKNMVDLVKNISSYFKIKNGKMFCTEKKLIDLKYDIYFSWKAPNSWKIKELPVEKLINIKNKLIKNFDLKIKFQKKNEKLVDYINLIKKSKLIVSIVNLGCHVANLYDKKLIMLSGPNYHSDSSLHKNQITIFPKNFCKIHKKMYKNKKYKNRVGNLTKNFRKCECMKNINENEIYYKIVKNIL